MGILKWKIRQVFGLVFAAALTALVLIDLMSYYLRIP